MEIHLTAQQEKAIELLKYWFYAQKDKQVFVLSGYAGTGKTFLISYFVRNVLKLKDDQYKFCAPTGKAAVVLMKKGIEACTLHKLIYVSHEEEFETEIDGEKVKSKRIVFSKRKSIEDFKLIILDEVSMVPDNILKDLFSFGIKVLCCGDKGQLPPVNGSNNLIDAPDIILDEVVRQSKDNPIVAIATLARCGEMIPYGKYGDSVFVIPQEMMTKSRRRNFFTKCDQVICGLNSTRHKLNEEISVYKGFDPHSKIPQDGEKLICLVNNWEKVAAIEPGSQIEIALVNGLVGYCRNAKSLKCGVGSLEFTPDFVQNYETFFFDEKLYREDEFGFPRYQGMMIAEDGDFLLKQKFDKRDYKNRKDEYNTLIKEYVSFMKKTVSEDKVCFFSKGWALTCHRTQGSEYDSVVLIDESSRFSEPEKFLYTGITRAKSKLIIVR